MNEGNGVINPFIVSGAEDYNKLIENFGCEKINESLIEKIEKITKKPAHPWLKRGIFFSHR